MMVAGRVLAAGLLVIGVAGCESTQDKAARLSAGSREAFEREGVRVRTANPDVTVLSTDVLGGRDGAAVVVRLRNDARRAQVRLPIAIDVQDRAGKSVFRNDAPGVEDSLVRLALLGPGATADWVHDQVRPSAAPARATARVGAGATVTGEPPRVEIEDVRRARDEDATVATGFVRNDSGVEQREIVVQGVVRRAKRVVAAGRSQLAKVRARRRAQFTVFFVGDARQGELELSVPPTVLKGAGGVRR